MEGELTAHFTGTSRQDAAREFARSWIEAKLSFSNTADAIRSKYSDMIKSMIVEGAAARVIDAALKPMWDEMDKMLAKNDIYGAIDYLANGMDSFIESADNGMSVLWKALEARGLDMKKLMGDVDSNYTGIAKNVAGASSEEINHVAAIGNTLMYYVSPIPAMATDVAIIRQAVAANSGAVNTNSSPGWSDWQTQAMAAYNATAKNTADTVAECRRAAVACEEAVKNLHRVIECSGGKARINVRL